MGKLAQARRAVGMGVRNPGVVYSVLRRELRNRWGVARDQRLQLSKISMPAAISAHLTRRCNLDCAMCMQYKGSFRQEDKPPYYSRANELDLAVWQDLLGQLRRTRPILDIIGGEPTLYDKFPEFLTIAMDMGYAANLVTNGTRLEPLAGLLVKSGMPFMTVSIDGLAEVHDRIRGKAGAFDKAVAGVKRIVRLRRKLGKPNPVINLNCTISKYNLGRVHEIVAVARDLEVDSLSLIHTYFRSSQTVDRHNRIMDAKWYQEFGKPEALLPSIPPGENYVSELTPEDLPVLRRDIARARELAKGALVLTVVPDMSSEVLASYYLDPAYPPPQSCQRLWSECRIMPDGSVMPCFRMTMGNIKDTPIREIWNGPDYRRFRQVVSKQLFPGCVRCCGAPRPTEFQV